MIFSAGQTLYKYQLISQLGQGNFGQVWLAKDITLDKIVAIKMLLSASLDPALLDEAKNGCRYNHPNLVKIHYADILTLENQVVTIIAQDYHSEGSVIGRLNSENFLPIRDALKYSREILCGLEHLHEKEFLHNDIKPSNILISEANTAILADYGISLAYNPKDGAKTSSFYRIHCAPETHRENHIHPQSDIYQVGCTLYRLVNGIGSIKDDFYRLKDINLFNQHKEKGKIPNKNGYTQFIPTQLKKFINKAVDFNPTQRFQSALEMRRAIERLNFLGDWTIGNDGLPVGRSGDYRFTYEIEIRPKMKFSLITWKEHLYTNRRTKVGAYTQCNLNKTQLGVLQKEVINKVINGSL